MEGGKRQKQHETANDDHEEEEEEEKGKEKERLSSSHRKGEQRGTHSSKEEFLGLKLRRGVAAAAGGRKSGGGAHTPVPVWKMELDDDDPVAGGEDGAAAAAGPSAERGRRSSCISARQLGASLWEIQSLAPKGKHGRRRGKEVGDEDDDRPRSSASLRQHRMDSLERHRIRERSNRPPVAGSPASYCSSIGAAAVNPAMTPSCSSEIIKTRHKEGHYTLKTSTELLKVLNRIWTLEEQHESHISAVRSLKLDLHNAHVRIKELEEERAVIKSREKERLKEELGEERRMRKYYESLGKKLGKELSELKGALVKAVKDLEKEKRVNSLLEDLCDEFANGIRDYEEEVRVLKQGNGYNNDHGNKFDRLILHVAEAWLDERMQIQMAEASGDLIEKNAIIERLSGEFRSFLNMRLKNPHKNKDNNNNNNNNNSGGGNFRRQSLESVHLNGTTTSAPRVAEEDDSDSFASDLHCFELDMRANGKTTNITDIIKSPEMERQLIEEMEGKLHGRNYEKGVRDNNNNTLKAKLVQARLEGRNARLRVNF